LQSQTQPLDKPPGSVFRRAGKAVDVVLLSTSDEVFETTRNAIGEEHPLWRAETAAEAIDLLLSGRCGVLVIDLGSAGLDPVALVRQVSREFPDLVVVATGRQTDAPLLGSTISEGLVYRFMHKPLSPNRAGMFLDHAIRCHAERREQSGLVHVLLPTVTNLPPRVERRYWYGAAAGMLAVIAALTVYLLQRGSVDNPPAVAQAPGAGISPEVLLPRANAALESGRLETPEGDNALDLYRDVLLAQPNDAAARAGLERATGLVLEKAHAESVAGRGDEARRLVRRVLGVDPANPLGLAMQARLEIPEHGANAAQPEEPREGFMTLLRREFTQTRRAASVSAPAPRAARQPPPQPVAQASPPPVGAAAGGAGPLLAASDQPAAAPVQPPGTGASTLTSQSGLSPVTTSPATVSAATAAPAASTPEPAAIATGSGPSLVPLREFNRVSTTQPEYPDGARRTGTEGWVRLEFTVNERGQVRDIVVVGAEPRGVFEDAASAALARWRFRPPVAPDGQPVPRRTSVQLRFQLQD
jgi:TonB family protein